MWMHVTAVMADMEARDTLAATEGTGVPGAKGLKDETAPCLLQQVKEKMEVTAVMAAMGAMQQHIKEKPDKEASAAPVGQAGIRGLLLYLPIHPVPVPMEQPEQTE